VRPSQLLYTYGVGSIIDLPDFSVLVMGLDDWPANADAMRTIGEDRLLAAVRTYLEPGAGRSLPGAAGGGDYGQPL